MKINLELERSEFNTIIAALRYWQEMLVEEEREPDGIVIEQFKDVLLDGLDHLNPDFAYLSSDEVEYLIEFINCE